MSSPTSPLGLPSARPRVDTHAPFWASFGHEAVALAQAAGLWLDPQQQESLINWCAVDQRGKWQHFECAEIESRQNGKGAIGEARVLAGLFLFGEQLIMWSAHEYKTAIELFLRIKQLIRVLVEAGEVDGDDIKVVHGNNPGRSFERLSTGQRVMFIARSKDSGRGFSGDLNIIDEAYAYTRLQQSALMPTMSARPNPQIVYLSTPPLTGATGEILYALRRRGDPTAPRKDDAPPWWQDGSLAYRDWGLAGDLDHLADIDLDDEDLWRQANPACPARIPIEFVRKERAAMSDEDFARERLGIWPREVTADTGWRVIPQDAWTQACDPDSQLGDQLALAVSVSWDRRRSSICAAGPRADGLTHVEVVENRAGTGWVVARLAELVETWRPVAVVINPGAPAGSLIPDIEATQVTIGGRTEPIKVTSVTARETAAAYGIVYDGLCGKPYVSDGVTVDPRNLRHIGQTELTDSVAAADNRTLGDGHAWDLKDADADVTPIDGITLAVHGWATRDQVAPPPATAKQQELVGAGAGREMWRPTSRLNL